MTRRLALRALVGLTTIVGAGLAIGLVAGFGSWTFAAGQIGVILAIGALDRLAWPGVDRWDRGACGEEHVGRILDGLAADGWLALHDRTIGRGNVDHIVIGPGGLLTIETKSHPGRIAVDGLDDRMLKQAYAEAKAVERVTGRPVTPLLVFSRAYLDRAVSRQRGVVVLPARMLAGHLARRRPELSPGEVEEIHARLSAALA
jgi:hypothetical protein